MKTCNRCGETKPIDDFYVNRPMPDGHLNQCKVCFLAAEKAKRATGRRKDQARARYHKDPERYYRSARRYVQSHPERVRLTKRGSNAVHRAIKKGDLIRPGSCEECGLQSARIEAAHYDYDKPLLVRWLCPTCHRLWDAAQPKSIAS